MSDLTASVVQKGESYEFKVENFGMEYEIWYSVDSPQNSKKLLAEKSNKTQVTIPVPAKRRLFFYIVSGDGQKLPLSTKLIVDVNITNFRDLGGYRAEDGRWMKWGKFYRSALLEGVSSEDEEYLKRMGLSTIFDFRSPPEVANRPDVVPAGIEYINRSGIVTMDTPNSKRGNLDMKSLIIKSNEDPELLSGLDGYLFDSYATMAEQPGAFKSMFNTIINKKGEPLLFHCTAGKDRTGVAGALILTALGIPRKTIMEDYLLSNFYRRSEIEKMLDEIRKHTDNPRVIQMVTDMAEVQPDFLNNTYKVIDENYGGMDGFFKDGLDLGKSAIEELKAEYLEA